jgi:hypothetical protein
MQLDKKWHVQDEPIVIVKVPNVENKQSFTGAKKYKEKGKAVIPSDLFPFEPKQMVSLHKGDLGLVFEWDGKKEN